MNQIGKLKYHALSVLSHRFLSAFSKSTLYSVVYYCLFVCSGSLRLYVFCLLVVLVKLSEFAKWLARKTPVRKHIHGKEIISHKAQAKQRLWLFRFSILFHCFIVYLSYSPSLHNISHTPMARYNLVVLKVSLNTNQPSMEETATPIWRLWLACSKVHVLSLYTYNYSNSSDELETCKILFDSYIIISKQSGAIAGESRNKAINLEQPTGILSVTNWYIHRQTITM